MKICKECKIKKDFFDFYGVQGECKQCTKKRIRLREEKLRENPDWIEKEKQRHREKYYRLNYKEKHKPSPEKKKEMMDKYRDKYPEKYKSRTISQRIKPILIGNHLHHWNYNLEYAKDVIEINPKEHAKIHRFMKYDKKTFMYKDLNGILLDTKEKHLNYINNVINFF
jgi:hypothetical protein